MRGLCSLITVAIVTFCIFFFMSHTRSVAAAAARRARAIQRGFLKEVPVGCKHILVASSIAPRAKDVAKSLELHELHNRLSGNQYHFAKQAAIAVRPLIGDPAFSRARSIHVTRDKVVHRWPASLTSSSASPNAKTLLRLCSRLSASSLQA